jgi:hypothetical protein
MRLSTPGGDYLYRKFRKNEGKPGNRHFNGLGCASAMSLTHEPAEYWPSLLCSLSLASRNRCRELVLLNARIQFRLGRTGTRRRIHGTGS